LLQNDSSENNANANNNSDNDENHDNDNNDENDNNNNGDDDEDDEDYTPLNDSKKEKMYHEANEIKSFGNEALIPTVDYGICWTTSTSPLL
jgi:hypothetical protein